LARITGLPVLGVISLIETAAERRRNRLGQLVFSLVLLIWIGAFVGVNFIEGVDSATIKSLIPTQG